MSQMPEPVAPKSRKKWFIAAVVIVVVAVVAAFGAYFLVLGDQRCPPGQEWVDQGDFPQAYKGCVEWGKAVKPIIYLYPAEETQITVKVSRPKSFTTEYPAYGEGWKVIAKPDGTLTDTKTGRSLYALYYESKDVIPAQVTNDGFVISGTETAAFLEEKLALLGLNEREAEEFIVYWLPLMEDNPYNYIRFRTATEIETNQALHISPKPQTVIRVMMAVKALDVPIAVTEQQLTPAHRQGYTAVEWGGTVIP